jgi:hypothetical protein
MIACVVFMLAPGCSLNAQDTPLNEGVKLIREGHFDQALVKLEQAHKIAPRNATIENLLGITETQLGHINDAMRFGSIPHKRHRTEIWASTFLTQKIIRMRNLSFAKHRAWTLTITLATTICCCSRLPQAATPMHWSNYRQRDSYSTMILRPAPEL